MRLLKRAAEKTLTEKHKTRLYQLYFTTLGRALPLPLQVLDTFDKIATLTFKFIFPHAKLGIRWEAYTPNCEPWLTWCKNLPKQQDEVDVPLVEGFLRSIPDGVWAGLICQLEPAEKARLREWFEETGYIPLSL